MREYKENNLEKHLVTLNNNNNLCVSLVWNESWSREKDVTNVLGFLHREHRINVQR